MKKITTAIIAAVMLLCSYSSRSSAQALNFGAYSYITLGDILPNNQSYSKEAWIRIHYYQTNHGCNILSSWDFPFWLENGVLSGANGYGDKGIITVQDTTTVPLNTWVHVAVTYDAASTTMKLYKNGILVATNTSAPSYLSGGLQIGAQEFGDFFDGGDIDEVRLWSVAIPQSQILANMNCDVPQQSTLAAYYRFNQGAPGADNSAQAMVYDYSGNTHCGTMRNFNLTGASSNYIAGAIGTCSSIPVALAAPGAITGASSVCAGATTTLSNAVVGGLWTVDDIDTADVSASGVVSGLYAGTVNISYATCGGIATKSITVNPTQSVIGTAATGSITTSVSGGTSPYTYSWSNNAIAANLSSLSTGTYSVTVTDAKGCKATGSYYVATAAVTLTSNITITPSNSIYTGGNKHNIFLGYGAQSAVLTDNITGSSSLTYSWSPSTLLSNATTRNPTFTPVLPGTYTYTCTATTSTGYSISSTVTLCVADIVDHTHSGCILLSHVSSCNGGHADVRSMKLIDVILQLCMNHYDYLGSTITACGSASRNSHTEDEETQMLLMGDELQVNVFPNPFNGDISVKLDGNAAEFADVTVYDLTGRVVEYKPNQPTDSYITAGENLVNGMYILEVKKGNQSKKIKVVKMK